MEPLQPASHVADRGHRSAGTQTTKLNVQSLQQEHWFADGGPPSATWLRCFLGLTTGRGLVAAITRHLQNEMVYHR
ncbi:hypothetical protein RB1601 [Rhodopirellula baltica SH 1]|uniref:Uncharacterized protein n=1 Tax=Rhodopirellula baltica (strain DSM 10527 / NCIMB 13988 / SH1) TaxID=243090 RepID=Q7UX30_RHOBA|nr:hypothetical protein RB1601 [Rhodopirellula baltica SH 1]